MDIGTPIWNAGERSYSFPITNYTQSIKTLHYYEVSQEKLDLPADATVIASIVAEFLEKTKKYFTNPLTLEKILRHLRHTFQPSNLPKTSGWFTFEWKPSLFTVKTGDFALSWSITQYKEADPIIPAEFTASTTPRAQSPLANPTPEQPSLRNIQIHDTLVPVGDLPLSDLPPLFFTQEESDPVREETKRRIREARLKVQLAKLKAQRMEQKYYERYGTPAEESEDSSEFSSDSEGEEELDSSFGRPSH